MAFIFDGKSRPTNSKYRNNWNDIFKPVCQNGCTVKCKTHKNYISNKCQKCNKIWVSKTVSHFCNVCWNKK